MKKNLLSIIILALLIVNLAMTGFMLLSVMSTNNQTAKLISDIAAALELEASGGAGGGFSGVSSGAVGVDNLATFELVGDDKMTINLKQGADGKTHYMVVEIVFSLNKGSGDYATLGTSESMESKKSLIKAKIQEVLSSHTLEEVQTQEATVRDEILEAVQDLFGSNFIYEVSFSSVLYQ